MDIQEKFNPPMLNKKFSDQDMQILLSNVLRYGVRSSLVVCFVGAVLLFIKQGTQHVDYSVFFEKRNSLIDVISEMVTGIKTFDPHSIIFLGILLLFITPVIRLIISLISFIIENDKLYIVITLIVMGIIGLSVFLGYIS